MSDGKWVSGIALDTPAVDAAQTVLAARLDVVKHYLPLAVEHAYEDREHIHQLRVSTRRAGAALRAFAPYLPRKRLAGIKRSLRTIRRAAGDARDWDVFLEDLPNIRALTTESGKPALDFLLGYALAERVRAQTQLVEVAARIVEEFREQGQTLASYLQQPDTPETAATFGELGESHLTQAFQRFNAEVEAALGSSEDLHLLHQLRIHAKRLRYAIEIVSECFTAPLRHDLYPALEEMQSLLGIWHDATVRLEWLEGIRVHTQAVSPVEWGRLRPGVTGFIRSLRGKRNSTQQKFVTLRGNWQGLTSKHPLEELRLTGEAV